jgi:hypothetical protein
LLIAGCALPGHHGRPDVRFRGEAADPIGDTASAADARVPHPADLVAAAVEVTDRALRFVVRFAPGSLDSSTTAATFLLDTDIDSMSGVRGLGVGADYLLDLHAGPARGGTISRATDVNCPSPGVPCRYAPIRSLDIELRNDGMEVVVPRAALSPFSGRLNVRVIAYANLERGRLTITTDHLPNLPAQFFTVR